MRYVTGVRGDQIDINLTAETEVVILRWERKERREDKEDGTYSIIRSLMRDPSYEICKPGVENVKVFEPGWKERQKAADSSDLGKTVELEPGEYIKEVHTVGRETRVEVSQDILPLLAQLSRACRKIAKDDPNWKFPFSIDPENVVLHCCDEGFWSPEALVEQVSEILQPILPAGTSVKDLVLRVLQERNYSFDEISDPHFEPLRSREATSDPD